MRASCVVGTNFGDEGKGKMVDYLSNKLKEDGEDCCVIRFNGGAQASHTVQLEDGTRHAFRHFGSGSFLGSPTFLSKYFIVNPIIFRQEYGALVKLGLNPLVYVDPKCMITTPYDMMINQISETIKGNDKHGSCGLGINETVARHKDNGKTFFVNDLRYEPDIWKGLLFQHRAFNLPNRLAQLGIVDIPSEFLLPLSDDGIIDRYIEDLEFFKKYAFTTSVEEIGRAYSNIIFEGAQGLLLDEDHYFFPHVSRSKTGLCNVVRLANQMKIEELDVYYLTRSYLTRHGAGPLPYELDKKPYPMIEDKTNIKNEWQDSLRFAYLDLDLLKESIEVDLQYTTKFGGDYNPSIVVSCMDQVGDWGTLKFYEDNVLEECEYDETFFWNIQNKTGLKVSHASYGPTRKDVEDLNDCVFA